MKENVIVKRLSVIKNRCPQNHVCPSVSRCPEGALKQRGHDAPSVDADICTGCGKCVWSCPMGALTLQ